MNEQRKAAFEERNDEKMSARTERLNELARKQKSVGLTDEEKAEQAKLREEFRAIFRANFALQLDNTVVELPDGTKKTLSGKDET